MHKTHDRTWSPQVIAHRGLSARAPENTAAAFDLALSEGADGIELDLQITADGVVVIYHDQWLTKLGQPSQRIPDKTWSELEQADAGGWFDSCFAGQRLLRLEQVFERWGQQIPLYLEIKAYPGPQAAAAHSRLADAVAGCLGAATGQRSHHVLSFSTPILKRLQARDVKAALVQNLDTPAQMQQALGPGCPSITAACVNIDCFDLAAVREIHARGLPTYSFTVDSPTQVQLARELSCLALISNDPSACRALVAQMA